ncbi:MAG: Gfo/Idh/MocA family oxidoreductase [Phycisphaerae bacterium]|nr:Gfo/Idh/MocA family oxidoreductase [Phycisphaerae bacterium]
MEKIRIGCIGVGYMGQMAHLRNYVNIDDCQVVALAELREKTGELVAERYGVPHVYTDHLKMLETEKLDGVAVIQPFNRHAVLLPEIYQRVKNVITEKPLAVSVSAGEALAQAASQAGCRHMVGYHKLSDPATIYVKETMNQWRQSGQMGKLRYIRMLVSMPVRNWGCNGFIGVLNAGDPRPTGLDTEPPLSGMSEEAAKEYMNIVNNFIHQINLMHHFLDESYSVVHVDKTGVLIAVQSASGVPAVFELEPYRTTVQWDESILIAFEKGYIKLTLPTPMAENRAGTVELYTDPGDGQTPQRTFPTLPWVGAMRQQAIHFIKVCKGEMAPPCDAAQAVRDLNVVEDCIQTRFGPAEK